MVNWCRVCGMTEEEVDFYPSLRGTCKECQKVKMRAHYKTPGYKAKNRGYQTKRLKDPIENMKHNVRVALKTALKKGRMRRPVTCSKCGVECKPHGHHEDYGKPFDVMWVCRNCHTNMHSMKEDKSIKEDLLSPMI